MLTEFSTYQILRTNYRISQVGLNFVKVFFYWQVFISITVTFIFDTIISPKITDSYRFVITFLLLFKKVSLFLLTRSFTVSLNFLNLKRFFTSLIIYCSSGCFCILNLLVFSPSVQSFETFWFTVTSGFKKTDNLVFKTIHGPFVDSVT